LAMADTAAHDGVMAGRRDGFPGCWIDLPEGVRPRKLGAIGLRVERGVSYHGIALNITTDLDDFELIDPCGLPDIEATSIAREAGWTGTKATPSTESVARAAENFAEAARNRLAEAAPRSRDTQQDAARAADPEHEADAANAADPGEEADAGGTTRSTDELRKPVLAASRPRS
jgi:lipoate-protein ligase B